MAQKIDWQLFPLLRLAVALILGVVAGYETALPPGVWLAGMLVAVVACVVLHRQPIAQGVAICLSFFLLGATLVVRQKQRLSQPLPADEVSYQAVVASEPQVRGKVLRMDLWLVGDNHLPRKVKASILRENTIAQGSSSPRDDTAARGTSTSRETAAQGSSSQRDHTVDGGLSQSNHAVNGGLSQSNNSPDGGLSQSNHAVNEGLSPSNHTADIKSSPQQELSARETDLHVGDGIRVVSRFQKPDNYYASNFDYPLYLRCHGFTATTLIMPHQWQKAQVDLTPLSHLDRTILAAMKFRQSTLRKYLSLGLDDEEMAVAVAMAMGDRSRITNDLRDIYSISGASHVLALSGLHLGIIYIMLSLMVGSRRLGVLREILIILGIWSYAIFTGLSPSVVRASVMITVYAVAAVLHRRRISLNALALTAILMVAVCPLSVYDVGFQMSFMAVLSIVVCYKPLAGLVSSEYQQSHPVMKWVWTMAVVSCCAQLGTAPLTAFYFGRFSVYFLLTNFFVIPLATAILYLTAAMLISSLIPGLLPFMARCLALVVGCQNMFARWVASLPGSSIEGININRWQLLMVYVVIAAVSVVVYKMMKVKNWLR